jgi:tetratricopeptide (TPR) repeat protein
MANSALIDDLLKQFADNPRRVFARLANEYRKRGELDAAIEICRSHVPLQPGYISGHIVLGQALYDSGSLEEARATFETALSLDPENLIALRHMGDIARANGNVESARGWYRQLLEIDPQNEDVAAQLESLGAPATTQDSPASADAEAMGGWGEVNPEAIDLAIESDALTESPPEIESDALTESPPEMELIEASAAPSTNAPAASSDDALALEELFDFPESLEPEGEAEDVEQPPVVAAVEGLEATSFQSDMSVESDPLELDALDELSVHAADAADSGEEFAEPDPTRNVVAPLFPAEPDDFSEEDSSADDAGTGTGAFATETMAELYLQQGFPDRALAIYRELAARSPYDASLSERIAELTEAGEAAPAAPASESRARTAREFFSVLAYRHPPRVVSHDAAPEAEAIPVMESDADDQLSPAAESDPQPVTMDAATEPAASAPTPAPEAVEARNGKPGHEATSALSLDDVFRDAPSADASGSRKGLSFDEFFARRGNGAAEQPGGTVATDADESTPGEERSSDDEPQDLELFHAWLDGLKG